MRRLVRPLKLELFFKHSGIRRRSDESQEWRRGIKGTCAKLGMGLKTDEERMV
jgi:hypothetical protein